MDDEDNDYEIERQKTIAENQELLNSLGLDPNGSSKIPFSKPKADLAKSKSKPRPKRKAEPVIEEPRRRSGRLAGLEATQEEVAKRNEEEEKEREVLRIINRKTRDQLMDIEKMVEDTSPESADSLSSFLQSVGADHAPRQYPESSDAYDDKDTLPAEVTRLKSVFKGMTLKANAKVTSERVYTMVVHPEPTKTLAFVGDKFGMVGIWDALSDDEGPIWHVQAHARSAVTSMKVDPIAGSGLVTSSYDCSLRRIDFESLQSTELFSFPDEDMLITHFDLVPNGREAWIADKDGGISHCDFREKRNIERRRWVVQEEGRAAKLGGISVNPLKPHLVITAGNDQHLRLWDTRLLSHLNPRSTELLTPPPTAKGRGDPLAGESDVGTHIETRPTSSIPNEKVGHFMNSNKGKGLLKASFQHGKSCSAAYWDPWGKRILTTSYDDKLRIWSVDSDDVSSFKPTKIIPHNCQTGRWLTILRAQWSLNTEYMPHFTVGNMKRTLDVVACTGDKIASLWTDVVTAVPAVTVSHPARVDHVLGGNTSGRIQLWTAS
ncbi:WD40-repeat-containing domain protein [Kockovaella imperatae]|uniref:DNA damage-binding protein CMR1 n=1 Tax=Kockovaella imperatae TaxID=4999 RepID=A0A1Y1UTJ2_9TREE|nr:WD40-repeat-containing domain protein [Kockovaella imperatae]ORX40746.1 WD40-repeat-containing domain protein [Kockovaella imperatae]